jgi:hypothetical protein
LINLSLLGIDVHKDTPVEILHTVLLGVVKYFWGQTIYLIKEGKFTDKFQARLTSISEDGLKIQKINAAYMCKYSGHLIGKHMKAIAQTMCFVVFDMVPRRVLNAWNVLGHLMVLLWHTRIDDLEAYLVRMSTFYFTLDALFDANQYRKHFKPQLLIFLT